MVVDVTVATVRLAMTKTNTSETSDSVYFESLVLLMATVGTVANGIVFYIILVINRKKLSQNSANKLILNQTALDLFSCLFLFVTYSMKLVLQNSNWSYWPCVFIGSEMILWIGLDGSAMSLCVITLERYVKIVHSVQHRKHAKEWMIYVGIAFSWMDGLANNVPGFASFSDLF